MTGAELIVGLIHTIAVALMWKIFSCILPIYVTYFYFCAVSFIICLIVARATYGFTKSKLLCSRVQTANKAVLITGCASGFGLALAIRLDSKGYNVFASCRNPSGTGVEELRQSCSKRLQILGLDVTNDNSVTTALDVVKKNLGSCELWAIVNNAGIVKGAAIELTDIQDFRDCMEVNAIGPVRVTKAFLPLLRQSKGRVVNIISSSGRVLTPLLTAYSMSKMAALAFNEHLRQEMKVWGIRVISVEPELFKTKMTDPYQIRQMVDATFASANVDLRNAYGETYMKNVKRLYTKVSKSSSSKLDKVLEDLEKAINLEYPDSAYRTFRNTFYRLLLLTFQIMPNVLRELTFDYYTYALGCELRPKEATAVRGNP